MFLLHTGQVNKYKTRAEQKIILEDREQFTSNDLEKMKELHPPDIMPNGNVGTPTSVFLEFIKQCRLPPVIIKKLGLSFPKMRSNKKYGNVPFNYGGNVVEVDSANEEEIDVKSSKGQEIPTESSQAETSDGNEEIPTEQQLISNIGDVTKDAKIGNSKYKFRRDPETKKRFRLQIEENLIGQKDRDSDDVSTGI